jgi:hypothetical protein
MEMVASATLALAMVACPVHHPLTLLHLTPLLQLKLKTMKKKKEKKKKKTTTTTSRVKPLEDLPHLFLDA